jgi:PKD repeat protein
MNVLKKSFSFLLAIACFQFVHAQITITSSDMPKSGDTIRYSQTAITELPDLTKTGTNYSWDYSSMGMESQGLYEYKASFQTPYLLNFGFSAIGQKISDSLGTGQLALQNIYTFYKSSSSKFETVGIGFQYSSLPLPQSGKHSNTDKIYEFPLKYNNKTSDDFEAKVPIVAVAIPIGNFFIVGTRTTEVDGWGKISTPYVSNVECIRVKSVIEEIDSVVIPTLSVNLAIPTTKVEYKWLSKTEHIPILEITGTEVLGNFVPTYIRYRDTFRTEIGPLDLVANFEADAVDGSTNDTFSISDMSDGTVLTRNWEITPNTYKYVNGTDENSKIAQVQFTSSGKYSVKLVIGNIVNQDSLSRTDYINVKMGSSVPELRLMSNIVYPNPFINSLNIRLIEKKNNTFVKLFNVEGRLVFEGDYQNQQSITISTNDFEAGSYILEVTSNSGSIHRRLLKIK